MYLIDTLFFHVFWVEKSEEGVEGYVSLLGGEIKKRRIRRDLLPGMVTHTCNPGTFGRRVNHLNSGVQDQSSQHGKTLSLEKYKS